MSIDVWKAKNAYSCNPSSVAQLDEMLRVMTDKVNADLTRFVYRSDPREVRWECVQHLRITDDITVMTGLGFHPDSDWHGFYSNIDGSWLLIVTERAQPESYIIRCGDALKSLWIIGTKITALPELKKMTKLTSMILYRCTSFSKLMGLGSLPRLASLVLHRCRALTELDLSGCSSLAELTGLIGLTQLTSLRLSGCSALTELNLPNCRSLTELTGLGSLIRLISLDLSGCSSLPELSGLDNLTQLTELKLSGCSSLTALPGLENLTQLTKLNLSMCRSLTVLPGLENLTQLIGLNLSWCSSLTALPGLDNLTQLTNLVLSGCSSLTALPGLDNLTRLTKLNLSRCSSLRELPEGIRSMESLRRLDLSQMKLQDLPDWLPEIAQHFSTGSSFYFNQHKWSTHVDAEFSSHLDYLFNVEEQETAVYLYGTTIDAIPDMSIFEQPYEMIVDFFRKRKLGEIHPLNEIKVVFLGDGEAGKSHTIARLMNDGGEPDHLIFDGQSTPGIVIRNKDYDLGDRKITVHYWDFGGQEIMHSMHRIFLTKRTMYVILLNARDDTQSDRAKYWLHNVKSFAPEAPVLLVLNKIDQNPNASVDVKDLHSRYDKLTQVVRLSAKDFTREQFNDCFTRVLLEEIQNTGYLDAQWPTAWTRVKEKLENMTSHYITGSDYQAICRDCRVDENQKNLLHWFNDLGISFCCDGEDDYTLEDYVILHPAWITNALYIILFNTLAGARNGLIPHKSIYRLLANSHDNPNIRCTLPEAKYSAGDIGYVLGIMRKFNLSFTDGANREFIPMLCQQNSMVDIQYHHKDAEILEFNMEFDYLPNNLLHRLMVERSSELDMTTVWRTGARFELRELGYSAVVVIDGNILRFFIRHTNPMHRPNTYLTMLKSHTDRIVEHMGLKAPTCQLIYKLDGKQDTFDYAMLKAMQEAGQTQAFSMTWRKMLPISDILNQSAPDGLEDEKKLLDAIKKSCLNIMGESDYYLKDGESGWGKEDHRNRRLRDDLLLLGYHVTDQTQRGLSGTGRGIGELDLLIFNDRKEPWTIIEALRVSTGTKTEWDKHLNKLVKNYNYFGAPCVYLLTYVDAEESDFARIWKGYQSHIPKHDPGKFTYCKESLVTTNDPVGPQDIQIASCRYDCGGKTTTAYHIFVRIPCSGEFTA